MAMPRVTQGELIDVRPLGEALRDSKSVTLMRSDHLEVVRLVLPAGKHISEHRAPGEITVCVFRTNVTGRFGIVTGDFGNVTGHFGNVTERTGRQDWRCA